MWAGVEPEPGQFNKTYVNILKEIVEKYKSDQIYFILDMHQDVLWETPGLFTFFLLFVDIIQPVVLLGKKHSGPENLKNSRPKKLVKLNKSISRKISWPKSIFYNFKNGQKSIFELGKSLKLPEMQFHEKKIDLFDFTSFSAWTFLYFLACCG